VSGEARRSFACFGGTVSVNVGGASFERGADDAAAEAAALLLDAHRRLSRFLPDSELSRLNRDPRETVPASPLLLELAAAARWAGTLSDGLVDATLLGELERAGYRESLAGTEPPPAPTRPPASAPASASAARAWSLIEVDRTAGTISRPPGLRLDSGGIAKGLLADRVAATLGGHASFAVNCCGDLRIGGRAGAPRAVLVEDPAGGAPLGELEVVDGAAATSGIGKRRWASGDTVAHHLLDPGSGRPAFTGIAQATALAPTAFLAEVYAKYALLSGPELAPARLPYGGVLVLDDGTVESVPAAAAARPGVAR
jgi:thiamine biosynthesis lipoprotein